MNVFQLFAGSFHSAAAYRHMRNANGFGMGYALFVVAVVTLIVTGYFAMLIYTSAFVGQNGKPPLFDQSAAQVAEQVPVMTLQGDTLETQTPGPTIITISGDYKNDRFEIPFATIDTSGASTPENVTTPILVTAKTLFVRSEKEWKSQPLSDFTKDGPNTILINRTVAQEMASTFTAYIHDHLIQYYIILWLMSVVCVFTVTFFVLLALGLVGLVISSAIHSPLTFASAMGLAALSFTPVAILNAAMLLLFGYAAHTLTIFLAATVALYAAIKCSEPSPRAQMIG